MKAKTLLKIETIIAFILLLAAIMTVNFSAPLLILFITKNAYDFYLSYTLWNVISTAFWMTCFMKLGYNALKQASESNNGLN